MTETISAAAVFARIADAFTGVVERTVDWDAQTPCTEWTARALLEHVIDTERDALARNDLATGPAPDLSDPVAAWARHVARMTEVLADPQVAQRPLDGYFGPTTVGEQLSGFYGWDLIVHRWDLARASGRDVTFTDTELEHIESWIDVFGDQMYGPGVCAAPLETAPGADRTTRVLAVLGRAC